MMRIYQYSKQNYTIYYYTQSICLYNGIKQQSSIFKIIFFGFVSIKFLFKNFSDGSVVHLQIKFPFEQTQSNINKMKFLLALLIVLLYSADALNYIKNGDFETPVIKGNWQILKSAGKWSSYTDEIELGPGTFYSPVWKTGQVAQLDANKNSQIYQVVSIPAGKYHLQFNWAARSGIPLASNAFSVRWNGIPLALITATDYQLHTFAIDVLANRRDGNNHHGNHHHHLGSLLGNLHHHGKHNTNNILLIKGEGISDGLGISIDNVQLTKI